MLVLYDWNRSLPTTCVPVLHQLLLTSATSGVGSANESNEYFCCHHCIYCGHAAVTGVIPSPTPYVPSFLVRIGFSIPTANRLGSNAANSCSRTYGMFIVLRKNAFLCRSYGSYFWSIGDDDRNWPIRYLFIGLKCVVSSNAALFLWNDVITASGMSAMLIKRRPRLGTARDPVFCWLCPQTSLPMPRGGADTL